MLTQSEKAAKDIEDGLTSAYNRIRGNARNGSGRGPRGARFLRWLLHAIPPQRQLDIAAHKKIIVCEHCGRILVDDRIVERVQEGLSPREPLNDKKGPLGGPFPHRWSGPVGDRRQQGLGRCPLLGGGFHEIGRVPIRMRPERALLRPGQGEVVRAGAPEPTGVTHQGIPGRASVST